MTAVPLLDVARDQSGPRRDVQHAIRGGALQRAHQRAPPAPVLPQRKDLGGRAVRGRDAGEQRARVTGALVEHARTIAPFAAQMPGYHCRMDANKLASSLRSGDRRAIARLISLVEDEDPGIKDVVRALGPLAGNAYVIGITGSPGVGKSTLAAALVSAIRSEDKKVSVLAVDPTSPFTGGALLGDRLRMQEHATDPGVFIRSMATRGHLGG